MARAALTLPALLVGCVDVQSHEVPPNPYGAAGSTVIAVHGAAGPSLRAVAGDVNARAFGSPGEQLAVLHYCTGLEAIGLEPGPLTLADDGRPLPSTKTVHVGTAEAALSWTPQDNLPRWLADTRVESDTRAECPTVDARHVHLLGGHGQFAALKHVL